jgi:hypothetical protein
MVTIIGMNQLEAIPAHELFRLVSEKFGGRRTPVKYFALCIAQRNRIGAVFNERPKALE